MLINDGRKYFYQQADGTSAQITTKKAETIFAEWKAAGKTIRRKYGMGGRITWAWTE